MDRHEGDNSSTDAGGGQPQPSRPRFHRGYGISGESQGMLSWEWLEERMSSARNYWIATTRPDGRPHCMPVWGVWQEGRFFFSTHRRSLKARHLTRIGHCCVHLESGDEVVILEGRAVEVDDQDRIARVDDSYEAKYGLRGGSVPGAALFGLRPLSALAWREKDFPTSATRWTLADDGPAQGDSHGAPPVR